MTDSINIISNTCLGGYVYRELNKEFQNPFIWSIIYPHSFIYLINNYDRINFHKVTFHPYPYFDRISAMARVDNILNINYVHYLKGDNKGIELDPYWKVDMIGKSYLSYAKSKYLQRLERMSSKPIFIFDTDQRVIYDKNTWIEEFNNIDTEYDKLVVRYEGTSDENTIVVDKDNVAKSVAEYIRNRYN